MTRILLHFDRMRLLTVSWRGKPLNVVDILIASRDRSQEFQVAQAPYMTIRWIDAYKIGHEQIDAEHQELFALVNQFLHADDKGGLSLSAMGMFKYTREHFTHEEDLMRDLGYPSVRDHVKQHNDLLSRLNSIAESIANDTLDKPDLESFLSHWLLNHIGTADAELAGYIRLQAA